MSQEQEPCKSLMCSLQVVKFEPEATDIRVRDRQRMLRRSVQSGKRAKFNAEMPHTASGVEPAGTRLRGTVVYVK